MAALPVDLLSPDMASVLAGPLNLTSYVAQGNSREAGR